MTAEDVLEVLDALEGVGVSVWLDGGWGIDALLGYQTRRHVDLDAVIDREDLARAQSALTDSAFGMLLTSDQAYRLARCSEIRRAGR